MQYLQYLQYLQDGKINPIGVAGAFATGRHAVQAAESSCTACLSVENRWPSRPSPSGACAALAGSALR
ncbi:protein of unknown function [Burkholderia multivorans]